MPSDRGLSAQGPDPDCSKEQEYRLLLKCILNNLLYMAAHGIEALNEICHNLTPKKQELLWLSLPTKRKCFRLKVPKASYQDPALDDLWIQIHTHYALSWVGADANVKVPEYFAPIKPTFLPGKTKFFSSTTT